MMTEPDFVNSLHANQKKAYRHLKAKAQEDLKQKLDLAVEALLPLAKIGKDFHNKGVVEDSIYSRTEIGVASDDLIINHTVKAYKFFKQLGIKI